MIVGIAAEKFLEGSTRSFGVVEVVFVNFADGKEAVETVFAARIFTAQELVLGDGLFQNFVVIEVAAHFNQRFGNGDDAGIGFGGNRRAEVDTAIGVQHALVVMTSAIGGRPSVEGLAHPLGTGEVIARPALGMMGIGVVGTRPGKGRRCSERSESREREQRLPPTTLAH